MATDTDVLIVGAGPAGSTAAAALRTFASNLDVILADRATFPRDKSCGDGLGPGVSRVLQEIDAPDVLRTAPVPGAVRLGGPSGVEGYAEGPTVNGKDLSGHVLPRADFDNRLLNMARERGATVLEGYRAVATDVDSDRRSVTFESPSGDQTTITARFVVAADGAYSQLRRIVLSAKPDEQFSHIATRSYAEIAFIDEEDARELPIRIDFERDLLPAYGWVFPTAPDKANIGVGLPLTAFRRQGIPLKDLLARYVTGLEERGIRIKSLHSPLGHQLPHAGSLPKLAHDRMALIGDAGSMINPLSGEGISYGMVAGSSLARHLASNDVLKTQIDASAWESAFKRRFFLHWKSCWYGHRLMRSPWCAEAVIRAAATSRSVLDDSAEMLFDEGRMHLGTTLKIGAMAIRRA